VRLYRQDLDALAVESSVVRAMDRAAIEDFGVPGAVLMENAGAAAAEVAAEMLAPGARVLVAAGAGNNAGDGFVIARHLANRGYGVDVLTAVEGASYSGDAATNFRVIEKMRLPVHTWKGPAPAAAGGAELIVDALLGTGLKGALRPPYPEMIAFVNSHGARVLAVDIPSGLDGDTGEIHTAVVRAARTVTFALPKKGLFIGEGPLWAGEVILADIGMPRAVYPAGKALPGP